MNERKSFAVAAKTGVLLGVLTIATGGLPVIAEESAQGVFEQRIVPIFKSDQPSSCVQCHLSSVDLKDYIRPSAKETLRALRENGLVDVKSPEQSKILTLIMLGETDTDQSAQLIHKKTRTAEYEAFKAWIVTSCGDADMMKSTEPSGEVTDGYATSNSPDLAVIRHARKDRVLDAFTRSVWSQRMRCFPCHTPSEIDPNNPKHSVPLKRYKDFVQQYGRRMDLFAETPLATMKQMIASSSKSRDGHLPLLNFVAPSESLLLLKPTAKLPAKKDDGTIESPSSALPVSHMGGLKMRVDDLSYKAIVSWIADYAVIKEGGYKSGDNLPVDNWYPTKTVIRIKDTPESWPKLSKLQLFVFPVEDGKAGAPVAFTQSLIGPRGFAAGNLFALGTPGDVSLDAANNTLRDGTYEVRVFLDSTDVLSGNPSAMLSDQTPDGTARVDAIWREGFPNALVIEGSQFN